VTDRIWPCIPGGVGIVCWVWCAWPVCLTDDEWMATQESAFAAMVAAGSTPTFAKVAADADFDLDLDELFEFGLAPLLDGLAMFLDDRVSGPTPS
jgi:hypothetical protein